MDGSVSPTNAAIQRVKTVNKTLLTCTACRSRKVRCDGVSPVCGPCSRARKAVDCEYIDLGCMSYASKGPFLQKGAACHPCRRKKKKCDAKRPFCSTCKDVGKERECSYQDKPRRNSPSNRTLVECTHELEQHLAQYQGHPESQVIRRSLSDEAEHLTTMGPPLSVTAFSELPSVATSSFTDIHSLSCVGAAFPVSSFMDPSIFVDAAPCDQSSPNQLIPFSPSLCCFPLPIPPVELAEFRVMFLSSLGQLGLSFSAQKLQAIVLGDHSNPTVPPVLIHVAQLMGCVLWRYKNESNKYSASEALQLHHVSQAMLQTREPWTLVEVHIVLAVYQFTQHQLYDARDYVEKAVHVVQQHNLHFPVYSLDSFSLVEPTDEVEEQLCALSQLLALDKTTSAVLNVPTLLDMEYEQRFATIPFFYPSISRNNLAILRARSALIMHQTRKLSAKYTAIFCSDRGLCDDYWALLHEATDHIANLHPLIMRASFQHDDEYCIGLKICLIIALTASAELYRIAPKSHSDSRQKCLDVLQEIMGMYRISDDTFFIIMEPILGICWMILANVVLEEERYALTKAASLYWSVVRGEIIGCVYRVVVLFPYMAPSIYMMKDIVQKSSNGITDERARTSGSAQVAEIYCS